MAFRIDGMEAAGDDAFQYRAIIPFLRNAGNIRYFDANIASTKSCSSALSALRSDGFEGACSDIGRLVRY